MTGSGACCTSATACVFFFALLFALERGGAEIFERAGVERLAEGCGGVMPASAPGFVSRAGACAGEASSADAIEGALVA